MKKVLPLAIAAALVAPMTAMADATVYGKIRTSVDYVDYSSGNLFSDALDDLLDDDAADVRDDSVVEINSWASRLGFKGSEDLGDGLKAVYKIEGQVNFANQTNEFGTGTALFTARNVYVGLSGGYGTILLGRHDTPLKMSTGKLDYFADTSADYNSVYSADFSDRRADGTLAYVSPNFAGLTLAIALVPGENSEANSISDAYSMAAMYSNGGIYAAAAYEAADGQIDALNSATSEDDLEQWRVGAGFDAGGWKIAGVYENEQRDTTTGDTASDTDKWSLSGAVTVGMGEIKGTYFTWDENESDVQNSGVSLGYDYNFSKRSQLYVLYTNSTLESPGADDIDLQIVSVGMNHDF